MTHKAMIKLTVSTQGYIRAFHGEAHLYPFFKKGKHIADTVHIHDKIALMTLLDNARIGKKDNYQYWLRFINQDGSFTSLHMENAYMDIHGIAIDCSIADGKLSTNQGGEPRHLNNASDANSPTDLPPLAIIAHEMREPLNAIIGFTDILLQEFAGKFANEKQRQYAGHIKESGQHLLALIQTYLEQQKIANQAICQDVDSSIAESIAMTTHVSKTRKVIFTPDPQSPCFSALKGIELKQVLINLITNAAKYSDENSIITIQRRILKNNSLLLTVSDTGIGISDEEIKEIRQPFKRAMNALSSNIEGYGIGLSLVFNIVEAVKGSIAINSKKNSGTTIAITLPLSHATKMKSPIEQKQENDDILCRHIDHSHLLSAKLREKYIDNGSEKEKINQTA